MRRTTPALVLTTAGFLLLTACSPALPEAHVDPAPSTPSVVLTTEQDESINTAIGETLAAAAATLDPAALDARLTGPALAFRTAEFTVATATGSADAISEIPTAVQSEVLPTTQTWPRTTFAVSERPQNLQTERLLVTEQASPREQYKLWGWIRLFPGVTLPAFPSAEIGTEAVAPDDSSLVLTPVDAVAHYADVLTNGDASPYAAEFATDPLREQMTALREKRTASAAEIKGTYTLQFTPTDGALRMLRTADGGALVVGEITSTETLKGEESAVISPSATEKAFIGDAAASNSLTVGRTSLVGIYIPPATAGTGASVIGSELLTTSASIP
ncbi:hypothetical protein SAMN05216410_3429 [Sanguibacter gelidistatuariae]|uniref:DUF8094 domain-containing protein n=1 Tax=Sanguibacter gelidistatuariae TaxID=1814289 RepID=A0A1G6VGA2_9MICO|nr:hypothetical protein [Sanguibacter gelidistatuariae]SDD52558.1 hypothetical protein SAMN05216410_3429 [Sanguibacter gelidistatuariae]